MKDYVLLFLFVFISLFSFGQYDFQEVLTEYSGEDLKVKIVENFKPTTVLDYSEARDILYGKIYNENDTVYGVYTHYGLYLPPGQDPSSYLYKGGSPGGINAEHTYPRSKGAKDGNAKSDMHHLFPSKINVNSDRGSLPFNEIKDNQTKDWYFNNIILHKIPTKNIDGYSEHINTYFEPREDHKGNVARAMMYFYTMYKSESDAEDPNYFWNQKEVLCKWHFLDPVDSLEWVRTWKISKYQNDKPNPFVLDCSLASRTYCDFISDACSTVKTVDLIDANNLSVMVYPNPSKGIYKLSFINPGIKNLRIKVTNVLGDEVLIKDYKLFGIEREFIEINMRYQTKGIYFINGKGYFENTPVRINKVVIID